MAAVEGGGLACGGRVSAGVTVCGEVRSLFPKNNFSDNCYQDDQISKRKQAAGSLGWAAVQAR